MLPCNCLKIDVNIKREIMNMNERITSDSILELTSNEIFVFGSNLAGRHGGAARFAFKKFGAI